MWNRLQEKRGRAVSAGAVVALIIGLVATLALRPASISAKECNGKGCDTEFGICVRVDVNAHCTGDSPCKSDLCTVEKT